MKTLGVAPTLSQGGTTLAYNGADLFAVAPFQSLEFSAPLPEGAVVQVVDVNAGTTGGGSPAPGVRAAAAFYRKALELNGDGVVNTSDLALLLSWIQTSQSTSLDLVRQRALEIFPALFGSVATLPALIGEDLNGDGAITNTDVVLGLSWIQVGRLSNAALIASRAAEIGRASCRERVS